MKLKKKDGINRRSFVIGGGIILLSPFQIINNLNANEIKRKITFGSCISQNEEQPIWDSIIKEESEAFIFMGDRWMPKNPIDGKYIWLPLKIKDDKVIMKWQDKWDLNTFN